MIGVSVSVASDEIRVGVRAFAGGPHVTVYLPADNGAAGVTLSMPFDNARTLACRIENAIAAHNAMVARSQEDTEDAAP